VPQSLRLFAFDRNVEGLVPAAKEYDYGKLPGKILLVDPSSSKVVALIEQQDATGSKQRGSHGRLAKARPAAL
jgi:hypothetical protein